MRSKKLVLASLLLGVMCVFSMAPGRHLIVPTSSCPSGYADASTGQCVAAPSAPAQTDISFASWVSTELTRFWAWL